MTPEHPEGDLIERALAEWDVPEPPVDLTDRILAHNADVLAALSRPSGPDPLTPLDETTPTMLPTEHRSSSSLRPLWTATLVGFAAAAALLLAFTAGRESVPEAPLSPAVPHVEIQVTAPVSAPPAPPARDEPQGTSQVAFEEEPQVSPPPEPPRPPKKPERVEKPRKAVSPDLKNPFADETGQLRIGTLTGAGPAEVYVDGKPVGWTPLANVRVGPGKHTVRFEWPDGSVQVRRVEVVAGNTLVVRAGPT